MEILWHQAWRLGLSWRRWARITQCLYSLCSILTALLGVSPGSVMPHFSCCLWHLFWSREFLQPGEAPGWAFAACWSPAFLLALLLLDTEVLTSGGKAKIAPKPAPKQCCVFSTWRLMWWHLWDDFPCPQPAWKCYSSQTAPTAWTSQLFHSLGVFVGFILAGRTPLLLPWPFPAVTA